MADCLYTKGFVRPILEYAPLAWMSVAPSHHKHLDRVQRRALGLIGHGTLLQCSSLRREVGALCYLYKLHYLTRPQLLRDMFTQQVHPISTHGHDTNNTTGTHFNSTTPCLALHQVTCSGLSHVASWRPGTACSMPYFLTGRTSKGLQKFKTMLSRCQTSNWLWLTDFSD